MLQRLKDIPKHDIEWGIIQLITWSIFVIALTRRHTHKVLKRQ